MPYKGLARRVRDVVQRALDKAGYPQQVELLFIGNRFQDVPRGRIEVWLPPLAEPVQKGEPPIQQQLPRMAR